MRVLIVARSPVMQAGIEATIGREPAIQVVGRASTLATVDDTSQPVDVVVLDAALLVDPIEELGELARELAIALLIDDTTPIPRFLQAGVRGILPHDASAEELVLTLEAISKGLIVLHPELAEDWLQDLPEARLPSDDLAVPLTPREMEVLQCLATGMANKAIARQLNISDHTVKFHVSSIFSKLGVSSRTEAVAMAMRQGLIFV